jgi:hypothetical protein
MVRERFAAQTRRTDEEGPTAQADSEEPARRRWPVAFGLLAVLLAVVLMLAGGLSLLTGTGPQATESPSPPPTPVATDAEGFPVDLLGLPVVTIARAHELIAAGRLDGRDVAVAGYWVQGPGLPCPRPTYEPTDLEYLLGCDVSVFSSVAFEVWTPSAGGGVDCCNRPPAGAVTLKAFGGPEASGWGERTDQSQVVLIGHVADPRSLNCQPANRADCASVFVVDRVAWVDGRLVELRPTWRDPARGMVAEEVVALVGPAGHVLGVAAIEARLAPTIDPRFEGLGDGTVWIVRAIGGGAHDSADPTRHVEVWLVDDSDVAVVFSGWLEAGP